MSVEALKQQVFLDSLKATIADLVVSNAQIRADLAVSQELLQVKSKALEQKVGEVKQLTEHVDALTQEVEALQRPSRKS